MTQRPDKGTQRTPPPPGENAPAADARPRQSHPFTTSIALVSSLPGRATGILTRRDQKTVRRRLSITAVVVAILAVTVASVGNYLSVPHTPEDTVNRYFTALEEGNYLVGIDRSAYSFTSTYLTDSVYRRAEGRVQDHRVLATSISGQQATAEVAVTVDGKEQVLTLPLHLAHKTGPYNDTWVLDVPAHTNFSLVAPVALARVTVNGAPLDLPATRRADDDAGYRWSLPLLPGIYTLDLPADSYYSLVGGEHTLVSALPTLEQEEQGLELTLRPSPRMWQETDSLIESWLERCENSRRLRSTGCPASARHGEDSTATIKDVRWNLVSRPSLALIQDSRTPNIWRASKHAPATFEVTYLADGKAQRETVAFYISAQVISDGNQADISVGVGNHRETREELAATITSEGAAQSTLEKIAAHSPGGTS